MLRLYGSAREEGTHQCGALRPGLVTPATHLPTPLPLTSSSAVQGRESEVLRRSEWPLARDVDDRRRLRAPLQLLGMLKAQRLW